MLNEKFKVGYQEYLALPKATFLNGRKSEIYDNGWVVVIGLACMHPHPHRHFTFEEFGEFSLENEKFFDRFIMRQILPNQ